MTLFQPPEDTHRWLQDRHSVSVDKFIKYENRRARHAMRQLHALTDTLTQEILSRLDMSRSTPASVNGEYQYYLRDIEGLARPLHCLRCSGVEEIIFDENDLSPLLTSLPDLDPQQAPADLRSLGTSPDQRYWVVAIDWLGNERYQLWVKDLHTSTFLTHSDYDAAAQIAWVDDQRFIWLKLDERNRPFQACEYRLDQVSEPVVPFTDSVPLFEEAEPDYSLSIRRSASGAFIFLSISHLQTSNEVYFLATDQPVLHFSCFAKMRPGIRYQLTHHGSHFYLLTNEYGSNNSLHRVIWSDGHIISTETLQHSQPDVELCRLQAFALHLVLYRRHGQKVEISILNPETLTQKFISLPEQIYTVHYADNLEFDSHTLKFFYSSLVTPDTLFQTDMNSLTLSVEDQLNVTGYTPDDYQCEYVHAETDEGVSIPISLVYKRDSLRPTGNPLLLYGYGAYGYSLPVDFTSLRLSLLDRGFIYAIAHVRGGGELGPDWHSQGKLLNKHHSFSDFICCAEYLKENGYTSTAQLAVMGESAGGLLVTAAVNQRPDLCAALIAINPFVDALNTLSNPELPGTSEEWVEWGNPAEQQFHTAILDYSPYENIHEAAYPDMLLTCSLHDAQVPYWEACKYQRRLKQHSTRDSELLLQINTEYGHNGIRDRYHYIHDQAQQFAWLIHKLTNSTGAD